LTRILLFFRNKTSNFAQLTVEGGSDLQAEAHTKLCGDRRSPPLCLMTQIPHRADQNALLALDNTKDNTCLDIKEFHKPRINTSVFFSSTTFVVIPDVAQTSMKQPPSVPVSGDGEVTPWCWAGFREAKIFPDA